MKEKKIKSISRETGSATSRTLYLVGIILFCTACSCSNKHRDWEGIWHAQVEYIPNLKSEFEFDLHRNLLAGEWRGRWEAVDLYGAGEIVNVNISDDHIELTLDDDLIFTGQLSKDGHSVEGVLYGFSLDGNDTLRFDKVDTWLVDMPARMEGDGRAQKQWKYSAPQVLHDGWDVADFQDTHRVELLNPLFQDVIDGKYQGLDAVLIAQNGQLLVEEYFHLGGREKLHTIQSCTKSITSLLIGIAHDNGLIADLSQPLQSYFSNYSDTLEASNWPVNLKHALTMSAALDWKEWEVPLFNPENDVMAMNESPDMYGYMLDRKTEQGISPGEKFEYNTGLSVLLGGVILDATGMSPDRYASAHLFDPLGIQHYHWYTLNGKVHTGGGLWLRPRDMLKLGQLVLNDGDWNGRQVVSTSWIKESTKTHLPVRERGDRGGYGYQWWNGQLTSNQTQYPVIWAEGLGGQFLFIVPDLDLVVLFMHHNPHDLKLEHTMAWREMEDFIIPAFHPN